METIESLERQRRKVSFDALTAYGCPVEDVDLSRFKNAFKSQAGRNVGKTQLINMGLLLKEQGNQCPTNAALLLSDSPARKKFFPYAKIECARFKGTDRRIFLDQATIEGPIQESFEPCMAFIKKNIALGATIGEIYREDRWEYPLEAIREALINAVVHRDYAILGSDIKVAIYDDMLEITSPGPLPDALSVEELGTGRSEIRNRVLAPIFKDLKLIEAWGSGIRKMKAELTDYPEIELVLQEAGQTFQVQFVKKDMISRPESGQSEGRVRAESGQSEGRVKVKSGQSEEIEAASLNNKIMMALSEGELSKAEIASKIGMKAVTGYLNRTIRSMLKQELIEYTIPGKPNSRLQKYKLKKQ